jgi:hypothetical protein
MWCTPANDESPVIVLTISLSWETIKMVCVSVRAFIITMLKHGADSTADTWHPDILRQRHIFASTSFEYGKTYYVFNQHPCTNTTF